MISMMKIAILALILFPLSSLSCLENSSPGSATALASISISLDQDLDGRPDFEERREVIIAFYKSILDAATSLPNGTDAKAISDSAISHFNKNRTGWATKKTAILSMGLDNERKTILASLALGVMTKAEERQIMEAQRSACQTVSKYVKDRISEVKIGAVQIPGEVVALTASIESSFPGYVPLPAVRNLKRDQYTKLYIADLLDNMAAGQISFMEFTTGSIFYSGTIRSTFAKAVPKSDKEIRDMIADKLPIDGNGNLDVKDLKQAVFSSYMSAVSAAIGVEE